MTLPSYGLVLVRATNRSSTKAGGMSDQTREAVAAAARDVGIAVGIWVEKALSKALAEGLEPGVSIEEIEARVRAVVVKELEVVQQALGRLEAANSKPGNVLSLDLARTRMRRRRMR